MRRFALELLIQAVMALFAVLPYSVVVVWMLARSLQLPRDHRLV